MELWQLRWFPWAPKRMARSNLDDGALPHSKNGVYIYPDCCSFSGFVFVCGCLTSISWWFRLQTCLAWGFTPTLRLQMMRSLTLYRNSELAAEVESCEKAQADVMYPREIRAFAEDINPREVILIAGGEEQVIPGWDSFIRVCKLGAPHVRGFDCHCRRCEVESIVPPCLVSRP